MNTTRALFITTLVFHAAAVSLGEPNPSVRVAPGKEFTYKISHGQPQKLEVYFPTNHNPEKAKVPGVLLFHGGGWTGGNLTQFRYACDYFARRGLARLGFPVMDGTVKGRVS